MMDKVNLGVIITNINNLHSVIKTVNNNSYFTDNVISYDNFIESVKGYMKYASKNGEPENCIENNFPLYLIFFKNDSKKYNTYTWMFEEELKNKQKIPTGFSTFITDVCISYEKFIDIVQNNNH